MRKSKPARIKPTIRKPRKMSVYLAGPMSGLDKFNFPAFVAAAADLRQRGFDVASPAEHDLETGFNPTLNSLDGFNPETAMRWDLGKVFDLDAVVVLPGWETSRGAAIETRLCWFLHKPVLRYPQLEEIQAPAQTVDIPLSAYGVVTLTTAQRERWGDGSYVQQPGHEDPADFNGYGDVAQSHEISQEEFVVNLRRGIPMNSDEIRVVSATGGEKGSKPEKLGAIDPLALRYLARVAAMGEEKYSRFNFLKGYAWSLSVDALLRHLMAFLDGEDLDPESGLPHTAHVAWHGLALTSFLERHVGEDDRFHG
jgi:hypothetical protein